MKWLKLSVACAALAVAGWLAWNLRNTEEPVPTGDATAWKCVHCGNVLVLNEIQVADHDPKVTALAPPSGGDAVKSRDIRRTVYVIRCDACRTHTMRSARSCPTCQTVYIAENPDGSAAQCPKCKPAAKESNAANTEGS